jgi:ubiquitin-protein ligase E3 C
MNTRFAVALLGVTLFCCTSEPNSPCVPHTMLLLKATCPVAPDALLSLLVECLIPGTSHVEMSRADALLRDAIVQRVDGRQGILLINALSLLNNNNNKNHETPHAAVLQLLQHLLSQQSELQVLASLVAGKGAQYVKDAVLGNDFANTTTTDMQVDGGESDDDDDENEEEQQQQQQQRVRAPPAVTLLTGAQRKAASSALSRSQLQTTPKLDRLHQELVSRQEQNVIQMLQSQPISYRQHMVDLAIAIGNATFWKEWGIQILKHSPTTTTKDDAPLLLRQSYLHVLHMLLQSCTGLRTATSSSSWSSPLLSQLAFDGEWLEALWRNVLVLVAAVNGSDSSQEELTLVVATTLFSNAFAHRLIALSDDEFLQQYTMTQGGDTSSRVSILAEHVIVHLRTMLYDLYWNKPVLAQDVGSADSTTLKAHRARLLLSGTKLWNSLYERWCRLVRRAPFCDEATWCFPRLTSRAADDRAAVLHIVHDRPNDNDSDDDDSVVVAMQVERPSDAELQNDALADSFRDPKMARILTCIPQALPFERRVKLFSSLLAADKIKTQDETTEFHRAVQRMMEMGRDMDDIIDMAGREQVEIRRDALYSDSKEQLSRLGNRLKRRVQVTFINQHGAPEAGIDGGGVFKEFLDDLIKEAFDPSQQKTKGAPALFSVTPAETLAVNMATAQSEEALPHYEFLGRVLGKAVYESILVEPQFCLPFLNQLLGKQNSLEDLKNLDNEYYTNLTKLRTLSAAEIDSLGMTFEMTLESGDGARRTVELLPGGSSMPVTKANVIQYVHLVAHQRLNVQAAKPTRAFLRGFRDLIPASWVRLFSAYELQKMISGDDTVRGIDVASLKAAMQYAAGYHPSQEIVQWFWEVIDELTPDQQRKFLRFMTSCSRQPLLGFQSLAPAPCIQQIRLPENMFQDDDEAEKTMPLPTSATCMNLLKLPNYRNKNLLRKKLVAAIESGAGFELT